MSQICIKIDIARISITDFRIMLRVTLINWTANDSLFIVCTVCMVVTQITEELHLYEGRTADE